MKTQKTIFIKYFCVFVKKLEKSINLYYNKKIGASLNEKNNNNYNSNFSNSIFGILSTQFYKNTKCLKYSKRKQ